MGEQLIARFHTDNGSEFLNVMKDMLIKKTFTRLRLWAMIHEQTEGQKDASVLSSKGPLPTWYMPDSH
eukprot:7053472-Lingulodinium_polyedra.AAC.1